MSWFQSDKKDDNCNDYQLQILNQVKNINLSAALIAQLVQEQHKTNDLLASLIASFKTFSEQIKEIETTMAATVADLDAVIANDDALEASLEATVTANTAALEALKAAILAGGSPVDLQAQVDKILARQANLSKAIQDIQAADAANQP